MYKSLIAAVLVAFGAATTASAATYQIDGLLSNYGASVVHTQDYNGDMSGEIVGVFHNEVAPGGYWDMDGNISFAGTISTEGGTLDYTAMGNIDMNGGGDLDFLFSQGGNSIPLSFGFDGDLVMGVYNGFADGVISLWGDTGDCMPVSYASDNGENFCLGMDLRIAVSPSEVPLPASALLLLGGVGAFAGLRRKKKAA